MSDQGIFIVLEGSDGSGKGTQFRLLAQRLQAVGYDVEVFDFPRYQEPSSHFIKQYLNGNYGPSSDISPYTASIFYALDRYEAAPLIKKALNKGKIVLADRYVGSNMAHQGSKFTNSAEQRGFFIWDDGLEYQLLGIPRPTISFFLRVPAEVSAKLIAERAKKTGVALDEHEKDLEHLKKSVSTYDVLCNLFPKDFRAIECVKAGKLQSIPTINDMIWDNIKPLLPAKPPHPGKDLVVDLNKAEGSSTKNQESEEQDTQNVKFDNTNDQENINIQIKKISMLAARSLYFHPGIEVDVAKTNWNEKNKHEFFTPSNLTKQTISIYKDSMRKLLNLHRKMFDSMVEKQLDDKQRKTLLNMLTPLGTLCDVKISGSAESFKELITLLAGNPLSEVRWLAVQLQAAAHKLKPGQFDENFNVINLPNLLNGFEKMNIDESQLNKKSGSIRLLQTEPRNELNLVQDLIYKSSNFSLDKIEDIFNLLSYSKKAEFLEGAIARKDNGLLGNVIYRWNLETEFNDFYELYKRLKVSNVTVQQASPSVGFYEDKAFEELDIKQQVSEILGESLRIYDEILSSSEASSAGYGVLSGHMLSIQFTTSAKDIVHANSNHKILKSMKTQIAQIHPIIGGSFSDDTESKQSHSQPQPAMTRRASRNNKPRNRHYPRSKRSNSKDKS